MRSGVFIVCGVVSTLLALAPARAASPAGHWQGAIEVPGTKLEVLIDLAQAEQGWKGEIDIPIQSLTNRKLEKITIDGTAVTFAIAEIPGDPTFHGTLSNDGKQLSGRFTQGSADLPFALERTGEAQLGPPAKSAIEKLSGFAQWVEQTRALWHVPGVAVAVVHGDDVVLLEGFGSRDIATNQPVTPDTLFAIGSSTKAFTAALLGMFVDEGRLEWDKPVHELMPEFALADKRTTELITPLDLLTHTSGLPAHDLMWAGSPLSREELFARLKYVDVNASLRQKWQYNNLMYMSAGMLAAQLGGKSWDALVRERLLDPLGMKTANTSVKTLAQAADRALGYQLERDPKTGAKTLAKNVPYRNLDMIAPCGAINANVREMVAWVRLQLAGGQWEGKKLLEPGTFAKLHSPVAVVGEAPGFPEAPYVMYAPGWFVQPYRGHRVIHHGGNIDGFSSMVGFAPDDRIGVVVLTNLAVTPLRDLVMWRALDQLLELEPLPLSERQHAAQAAAEAAEAAALAKGSPAGEKPKLAKPIKPAHELADYSGVYEHPAYGAVQIELRGGKLQLAFHDLSAPLEPWHFDVFKAASDSPLAGSPVQFDSNVRGDIVSLAMTLEPNVDPVKFRRAAPKELSEPDFLKRFLGDYKFEDQKLVVSLRGQKLFLALPGQPAFRLIPYRDGEFEVQGLSGYAVRFNSAGDKVSGFVLIKPDGDVEVRRG